MNKLRLSPEAADALAQLVKLDGTVREAMMTELRPGDAHKLPPGAKRADGRDADKAREAQRRRRAAKNI